MFPWGHFAVAYLAYSVYSRLRFRRPPGAAPALAVGFGAVFADLVDKTLGWGLGIIPSRSLAHSLVVAVPLLVVVYVGALVYDRVAAATAFAIAHLVHLFTDLRPRVFLGYPIRSEYLLWPIITERQFDYHERVFEPPAIVETVVTPLTFRPLFILLEIVLFGLALLVWYADGCPGLAFVRSRLGNAGRGHGDRTR